MEGHNQALDRDQTVAVSSGQHQYLPELLEEVLNPLHRRLLEAYRESDPVDSMENELGKILLEVLSHEN